MKKIFKKAIIMVTIGIIGVSSIVPMASAETVCGNEYVVKVSAPYCEGKGCGGKETSMISYQDFTIEQTCVENSTTFIHGRTERHSNGCC